MDCTTRLISVCFPDSEIAKSFHSARTKTEAIITGVLAPLSIEELLNDLKAGTIFSSWRIKDIPYNGSLF